MNLSQQGYVLIVSSYNEVVNHVNRSLLLLSSYLCIFLFFISLTALVSTLNNKIHSFHADKHLV